MFIGLKILLLYSIFEFYLFYVFLEIIITTARHLLPVVNILPFRATFLTFKSLFFPL